MNLKKILKLIFSKITATYKLQSQTWAKKDLHIHVPAGALPKDGPSAGVVMFTAITSLIMGRTINPKLAMTGEITLRGRVLPIGGLKEKALGAIRSGIRKIIIPEKNKKDLAFLPGLLLKMVAGGRVELPTRGFSIRCSTN